METRDTIVAIATPPGRGGVSILRLSGPRAKEFCLAVLGKVPAPRVASFSFLDAEGEILDQGLALYFKAPHSFTGDEVLEFQGHGGPLLVSLLIKRLLNLGARLARPGEFSERAFLSGKIDLAQAEAIADLIHAGTEQAARSAQRSLQGEFSKKIRALVDEVIELRTYIEAAIDFAEEEVDFLSDQTLHKRFDLLLQDLTSLKQSARQGCLLRDGITVVIAGKPNVGKSTLLNLLSGKDSAIVTEIPGTTRDTLREQIQIDGLVLHLIDTAGLRETEDPIEQEGIRRAQKEIEQADLLLYLINYNDPLPLLDSNQKALILRNKIDLANEKPNINKNIISLSAKQNQGLDLLKQAIKEAVGFIHQEASTFSARERHLAALENAQLALQAAFHQLKTTRATELIAEDCRQAQKYLNEITGEFTTEDLLGKIFSSFCIGK